METLRRVGISSVILCVLGVYAGANAYAEERRVPSQYLTIQAAIDASADGDVVIVEDDPDPYSGPENTALDFGGRRITVRSEGDNPEHCKIDCENGCRAFHFHSGESADSIVRGFKILRGWVGDSGGGILCEGSSPTILNCVFDQNTSDSGSVGQGGGAIACVSASSPLISRCDFMSNSAARMAAGGGVFCKDGSSPAITNCTFNGNTAHGRGGAVCCESAGPIVMHCRFSGNSGTDGAAVCCTSSFPTLVNCLINGNTTTNGYFGGSVLCTGSTVAYITNCTIAHNPTHINGGLYCEWQSYAIVTNCVLWGNTAPQIVSEYVDPIVTYSDIQAGWTGEGNISADPLFVVRSIEDPWKGEHYLRQQGTHELPWSPCVNAGNATAAAMGLGVHTTRIDLVAEEGTADMGYHYYPADCNGNGQPDPWDIARGTSDDCNYNGTPDWCDINVYGTSEDENSDGVPDECQGYPDRAFFSLDEDFDLGTLINVNHGDPEDPLDELRRNEFATPLPYLWVPASARGTIVRIDTDDTLPGGGQRILGEYYTAPDNTGSDPSRTAVDLDGNVWVANREDDDGGAGSVTKIGLIKGGTRCDASGTRNPYGEYLKPPFDYNTCVDRNGDGLIRTSRGLGDILAWPGAYGSVSTALDECIRNYVRVGGTGTRHTCVNADNDVWVAGRRNYAFELLDGETGDLLASFNVGAGGYGGLIDCAGVIWSSHRQDAYKQLLRYDTKGTIDTQDDTYSVIDDDSPNSYGLGIDRDGYIWNSQWSNQEVRRFDPDGTLLGTFSTGGTMNEDRGVAATFADNDIWVANSGDPTGHEVTRLNNDGQIQGVIELNQPPDYGYTPTALAVDAAGKVWVTCRGSDCVKRIDPDLGVCGAVDLSVSLDYGAGPYAYSDMTGQVTLHTSATGTWHVVHDGGHFGADWHLVLWNRDLRYDPEGQSACPVDPEPEGTALTVEVRAADFQSALPLELYVTVEDGKRFDDVRGRYLEIRVRFKGTCPGAAFESPALCNLVASQGLADLTCDGLVNNFDLSAFVLALTNPEGYSAAYPDCDRLLADVTCDGLVNNFDIAPFVDCVTNGGCNPCP
ncbi:MAG: right-handed parallel beta-helix repeat-containing protein [Phycisphaerae bacterium]|jgi:streptogramin lyase